ncbi:MAG: hypothetical protein ACD_72C00106G0001 [uncultured bacterium]|nr:MAG: hypothetical protein ACD_72C00106G0001 [uncultured bacterium]
MGKLKKIFLGLSSLAILFSYSLPAMAADSKIATLITKCGQPGILKNWPEECKDVSVFVYLLMQLVSYLFGIVGAIALGVFVYGGFVLILSQGNQEKIQQGTGAMVNAFIGMFVSFTGYVLISFVGQVLGLQDKFSLF